MCFRGMDMMGLFSSTISARWVTILFCFMISFYFLHMYRLGTGTGVLMQLCCVLYWAHSRFLPPAPHPVVLAMWAAAQLSMMPLHQQSDSLQTQQNTKLLVPSKCTCWWIVERVTQMPTTQRVNVKWRRVVCVFRSAFKYTSKTYWQTFCVS